MTEIYLTDWSMMWLILGALMLAVVTACAFGALITTSKKEVVDGKVTHPREDAGLVVGLFVFVVTFLPWILLLLYIFNAPANAPDSSPVLGLLMSF